MTFHHSTCVHITELQQISRTEIHKVCYEIKRKYIETCIVIYFKSMPTDKIIHNAVKLRQLATQKASRYDIDRNHMVFILMAEKNH